MCSDRLLGEVDEVNVFGSKGERREIKGME